jgi:hypothetical protein
MTNLNLIRRFYCTPVGNYYFIIKKKDKININNTNKKHISQNKNKNLLISNNKSYKFLYNFQVINK